MAGGKGTRFWPSSRAIKAKQFLNIVGHTSLINQTITRISALAPKSNRWILGNQTQSKYLKDLTKQVPSSHILKEPFGKNTAACIGWGAIKAYAKDKNAVLAILPSDHIIQNKSALIKNLKTAATEAEKNHTIVTIGIQPTSPHTGYGYIEAIDKKETCLSVKKFHEKPTKQKAESYLIKKTFYWNSGMFICRADKLLSLIKTHMPNHYKTLQKLEKAKTKKEISTIYQTFDPISIDIGIMEKATKDTRVIPSNFDWNDIGSWAALEDFLKKDPQNNAQKANTLHIDSHNNIIYSETNRLIATAELNNMIVVDTPDALLIMPKHKDQLIKDIYEKLPNKLK